MAETSENGGVPVKADKPEAAVIETGERSPPKDKGSEAAFEFDSSAASVRGSSLDDVEFRGGSSSVLRRDRPYSSSVISRRSTKSTQSRASLNPSLVTSDYAAKTLFAYRSGLIDDAVNACKAALLNDLDGEVKGFWLLTEIDHWDLEKEKLVLLTTNSIIIVKYDFIAVAIGKFKRIFLRSINKLQVGDLAYPPYSVMPPRQHGGLRVQWAKTEPSLVQKWNPFFEELGYATLTHHLLIYNEKEKETTTFNVSDFADSVIEAVDKIRKQDGVTDALSVEEGPIMIESYASLSSMVYNQSHIGFNMERGGISF